MKTIFRSESVSVIDDEGGADDSLMVTVNTSMGQALFSLGCEIKRLQQRIIDLEATKEEPKKIYGQKVSVVCACGCGREKQVRKADVDRGWGKYFSKSCKMKHQQQSKGEL